MSVPAPVKAAAKCSTAAPWPASPRWTRPSPGRSCSRTDRPTSGRADDGGTRPAAAPRAAAGRRQRRREAAGWLELRGISRHNLRELDANFPLGVLTAVTGVSGSGKSTLVSQVLAEVVGARLHPEPGTLRRQPTATTRTPRPLSPREPLSCRARSSGLDQLDRLVKVDQKPIGRTPRSNLATYTGLFDAVRKEFAATDEARARGFGAGRFSFNVAGGRCETCQGEGFVAVELLFLPGSYGPCPECHGSRYNPETLEVTYRGKNVAEVLGMTVDAAAEFLDGVPAAARSLQTLREVGLGYLRLGQPATELSGGEAQRIKLATELQRAQRGHSLYLLDEPTTGPAPGRRPAAHGPAAPAGGRRQHRHRGGTRDGRGGRSGLGDRPRPGRWRRRRQDRRRRDTRRRRAFQERAGRRRTWPQCSAADARDRGLEQR